MKQNLMSEFRRYTALIQRQCPALKQCRNKAHNVGTPLIQRCFKRALTLVKAIMNPIGLVMIMDLQIDE